MTDPLKPGWLQRQFERIDRDIAQWPECMKREAGFTMTDPRDVRIAQLTEALESAGISLYSYDKSYGGGGGDSEATDIARLLGFDGNSNESAEWLMSRQQARAALTPKPDAPPAPYGQGSGPLPGKNVTVVQTGDKTLFITAPDAPPNPAAEPEPINYHRAVEHLLGRIETLEGALRRADDRLAAIHLWYACGELRTTGVPALISTLPTLIEEGEKALREEEPEECPNCANPPHDGPCRRKSQEAR